MSEGLSMSVLHIKQELDATTPTAAGTATTTSNATTCYSPSTPNSSIGLNRSNSYSNGTSSSTNSGGGGGGSRSYNANVDRHTPSTTSSTSNGGGSTANGCLKSSPSVSPERQQCSSTTHSLELGSNKIQISIGSASQNGGSQATSSATAPSSGGGSIRDELRRLCLVCGDVASGFHYGVASCEACKAFFKRTIQGNIEYTCPANNECEINKRRRKACQACRFQKCLRMGMLKEGVRLDRVRGGRQKYRRNPVSNSYQTMQLLYQSNTASLGDVKILEVLNAYEPDTLTVQQHPTTTLTSSPNDQPHTTTSTTNEDELRASMKNENSSTNSSSNTSASSNSAQNTPSTTPTTPTAPASGTPSTTGGSVKATPCIFQNNNNEPHEILCVLSDLYDKELVLVIGWAKQIPGFTELPLNDQMKLLQVSWTELLTLQVCFRSLPFNGKLCFATDVWLDELLAKECGYIEFYYHCVQIAQRLERISPRREEYYLLKALLLANCDILLDDQSSLRAFRDTILNSFNDVVYLLRHSAAVTHQQHLMLVLPSLRQADEILRRFWRRICRDETVTMKKLFVEMLEPVAR